MDAAATTKPNSNSSALVLGAGKMGNAYIEKLISQGIPAKDITVVDISPSKLEAIKQLYPEVRTSTEVPNETFKSAFVLSNSPAHLENLRSLAS